MSDSIGYDASWTLDGEAARAGELRLSARGLTLSPWDGRPCQVRYADIRAVHLSGEPNQLHAPADVVVELRDGGVLAIDAHRLGAALDLHSRLVERVATGR